MSNTDRISGYLEVGINDRGDVVINHPALDVDAHGVGHVAFSPRQARGLALTLLRKVDEVERAAGVARSETTRERALRVLCESDPRWPTMNESQRATWLRAANRDLDKYEARLVDVVEVALVEAQRWAAEPMRAAIVAGRAVLARSEKLLSDAHQTLVAHAEYDLNNRAAPLNEAARVAGEIGDFFAPVEPTAEESAAAAEFLRGVPAARGVDAVQRMAFLFAGLRKADAATTLADAPAATPPKRDDCRAFCPPEMRGPWRNWHRGSGCSLDDGKPRTSAGAAEIAALGVDHPVAEPRTARVERQEGTDG